MGKFKFPSITLGGLFKRKEYDPTEFQNINEVWDETTTGSTVTQSNVSATGKFQNTGFLEKASIIEQKLKEFDDALPTLKK